MGILPASWRCGCSLGRRRAARTLMTAFMLILAGFVIGVVVLAAYLVWTLWNQL